MHAKQDYKIWGASGFTRLRKNSGYYCKNTCKKILCTWVLFGLYGKPAVVGSDHPQVEVSAVTCFRSNSCRVFSCAHLLIHSSTLIEQFILICDLWFRSSACRVFSCAHLLKHSFILIQLFIVILNHSDFKMLFMTLVNVEYDTSPLCLQLSLSLDLPGNVRVRYYCQQFL